MNITFKQLEALYFSVRLGSFSAAAAHLSTTQSAISKRVGDLEDELNERLLHRLAGGLTATPCGARIFPLAEEAMRLRQRVGLEAGRSPVWQGRFRLGVTELTALTWLGALVRELHDRHPGLTLEPVVDAGMSLFDMLRARELDMAIMPGVFWGEAFCATRVGQVDNVWMASPALDIPDRPLKPHEFEQYPVLEQSKSSGKNHFYEAWKAEHGFRFNRIFSTNSLSVLSELAISGLGISQLSIEYFQPELDEGLLRVVRSDPMPPAMVYSAVYHADGLDERQIRVAELAASLCDFSRRARDRRAS
jgi:DNA-binding transcriptional LysR family regulator